MLKLDHNVKVLLLFVVAVLACVSPAHTQDEVQAPKPLDLLSFVRSVRDAVLPKPEAPATAPPVDEAPARPVARAAEDARLSNTRPLVTGAVPAPAAKPVPAASPAPAVAPPAIARPAKPVSITAPPKPAAPPPAAAPSDDEVVQFCSNVTDPAVDARIAWQLKELEQAENRLRERMAEVEAKRAEYEKWMVLRDDFLKKAEASMVEIYSRMRPEAAATQIAGMADETAAAVLAKLSPRSSSAIFNEMESARAAHLADLLAGMRRVDDGKK
jgi:flagellar motility protein MotE (MotC chaperone)